ncbi:MAG: aldo/keto reductase [Candidatus Thermoplasmatota archaeon]|jgi:diketogulonate reductase-like aldo/keto reductase|nr:aldo/keto reductase [Candidatus Thermoplasmatota archaeon]
MIEKKQFFPFGIGTWRMGGASQPDYSRDNQWVEIINRAIQGGINVIDTAEMYGAGHSEELVGRAVETNNRKNLFIITKAWPSSYGNLRDALNRSLRRMKTDYVDLYLLHWPDENHDLPELIKDLLDLKDDGLARYVGVSNFGLELLSLSYSLSSGQIYANQIELNVSRQSQFNEIREFSEEKGILPIAYSPLNRNRMPENHKMRDNIKKSGLSVSAYSLLYTISLGAYPVPKFSTVEHLEDLLSAYKKYEKGNVRMF